jgi:hypothetical protein
MLFIICFLHFCVSPMLIVFTTFLIVIFGQIIPSKPENERSMQKDCNYEKLTPHQVMENKKLIDLLSDENLKAKNSGKFVENIRAIGDKRIIESVPALIGLLDFKYENPLANPAVGFSRYAGIISSDYPAVEALVQIGKPSLQALTKVIEDEETKSLKSDNALYAIQLVFRNDLLKAVEFLEKSVVDSPTRAGKERLQIAVDKTREESMKNKNNASN